MKQTTLCYIEDADRYLMLHRVKKAVDENKDKWVGIGGKFEEGESPEDCVLREVREETGLTLTRYRYRGIITFVSNEWGSQHMHLFTADGFTGDITDCDEGRLAWVLKNEVTSLPIWTGDKLFLHLLTEETPFFSLKLVYDGELLTEAVLNGERWPQKDWPQTSRRCV